MTIPVSSRRPAIDMIGALTLFQTILATAAALAAGRISLPGCPESCGDVQVPYPFGIGQGCFFHEHKAAGFNLICNETLHPPKLFLAAAGAEVLGISLPDGTVRVGGDVRRWPGFVYDNTWYAPYAAGSFRVSSARNSFVAFGCNVVAQLIP
uniref:Wall-associated receptor kinase galacturonan-binding domain-containing protein n=3 Tax=Oryza brachyantha TaxID=4533 RepID=J3N738_ORYBR